MAVLLLVIVGGGFVASLLPFLFPGAVIGLFGVLLNGWLGDLLMGPLQVGRGALVAGPPGDAALTLAGVFAVYGPVILALLFILRGRGR